MLICVRNECLLPLPVLFRQERLQKQKLQLHKAQILRPVLRRPVSVGQARSTSLFQQIARKQENTLRRPPTGPPNRILLGWAL